jgi:esterase/lipase superfamily enzyme
MNKLIKQLADQCMVEVKNVPCKGIDGWTTLETVRQIDPEKFAELLVKEVTNIVLHYTDVDEGVTVAKKHFGVEE